ncbi:unnamed protein product [Trichobilharzia regenti]|nr:unnamed protein product [Trichobilharzia regenti]
MVELELAKMRIAQLEKEIELERLRQASRECSGHDKSPYKPSTSHTVAVSPNDEFARAMSKSLDMPKRVITKFDEAKDVIKHCALLEPEEGYHRALELLEEAFSQRHVVARTFIEKRLEFPDVKSNDAALLRKLSHEMQACELTLKQMNHVSDLNSGRTIEQLVLKLPVHSQREWIEVACNVIKSGREPSFSDLCLFIKEQSDIANTSGSDATLVTEDLARELGLAGATKTVSLKTLGSQSTLSFKQRLAQLQRVVPTADQMASWNHLDGIVLPEVKNEEIKMLIGCNVPEAHVTIDKMLGGANETCAVETPLG